MAAKNFVTCEWLEAERKKPDLVVVDGSWYLSTMKRDGAAEHLSAHIPGAVHFDLDEISDKSSALPHMLPSPEVFALHMARLGISDGQRIVVYDGAGLYSAPRVWWTFKIFGVKEVFMLEGGFPEWRARNLPVESGPVVREPGHFTPKFSADAVAGIDDLALAAQSKEAQIVDARPAGRFRGEAPEPRAGLASGHIPGSLSVPSDQVLKDGRLASPEHIKKVFDDAGLDPDKPIIASCGSGVSAVILWVALEAIGKKPTAVYDGSWADWGSKPSMPVETGSARPANKT